MTTGYEAPDPDYARKIEDRVLGIPAARLYGFRFGDSGSGRGGVDTALQGGPCWGGGGFRDGAIVAPGEGDRLVARGRVVRPGRALTVAAAEVFAVEDGEASLCATALVTMRNTRLTGSAR